jgi:protein-L-isoaspartate(D-aspartate) O-methyltransferase
MVDAVSGWWADTGGRLGLDHRVLAAMRAVPRHTFVPHADLDAAYGQGIVSIKRATDGRVLSCASAPSIVALMLSQLDVRPGHRVLEVGAGSGYQAALLDDLSGTAGRVTTIDVEPDVTGMARRSLDVAGYPDVEVLTGNGAAAIPGRQWDRVIVAVGPWDLPPCWRLQLVDGGRLVVPLRLRGSSRLVAFTRHGGTLVSSDVQMGGFVPMTGPGQHGEQSAPIHEQDAAVLFWDADQDVDPDMLTGVLADAPRKVWSGVTVAAGEPYDGVWLRMLTEPGLAALEIRPELEDPDARPAIGWRNPTLVAENALAYLTVARVGGPKGWELGAVGHGPRGSLLADRICRHIREWSGQRTARPTITAYPADTPTSLVDGHLIDKPLTRLGVRF